MFAKVAIYVAGMLLAATISAAFGAGGMYFWLQNRITDAQNVQLSAELKQIADAAPRIAASVQALTRLKDTTELLNQQVKQYAPQIAELRACVLSDQLRSVYADRAAAYNSSAAGIEAGSVRKRDH